LDDAVICEARVFADSASLTRGVSDESLRIALDAVLSAGRCSICLSGGTTPKSLNKLWAGEYATRFPWKQIHLFWGDERYVPADDARSNFRMARETLLSMVSIPAANIHPMPTDFERPADAATAYESTLREYFGERPEFDLLFLGIGEEGHTASLFPDSPALTETKRWVSAVEVPAESPHRLTLTYPVLDSARNIFFLVEGAKKREIISAIRREPEGDASRYPAARVRSFGRVIWFLDQAAAF
jgi:6-phosphogluconolactonase